MMDDPKCTCGHRQSQHAADVGFCYFGSDSDHVCNLFHYDCDAEDRN
jgi:hypothetical protein